MSNDNIIFKARSDKYTGQVLVWEKQLYLLMNTNKTVFGYQVQDGPVTFYTVQSVLQAFLRRDFVKTTAKSNGKDFYKIAIPSLVEA